MAITELVMENVVITDGEEGVNNIERHVETDGSLWFRVNLDNLTYDVNARYVVMVEQNGK